MISGYTKIIAHIGVPTEGFISPMIYNPWFESKGIDTVVIPFGCEEKDYRVFLKSVFRLRNIVRNLIQKKFATDDCDGFSSSSKLYDNLASIPQMFFCRSLNIFLNILKLTKHLL